ncbi:MAG TPA: PepSY domain-containing protein [Fimbriimonadaceae bacterium]|nr:PepSY domain-containing protein [Fimbriimonadaceae bacterium]
MQTKARAQVASLAAITSILAVTALAVAVFAQPRQSGWKRPTKPAAKITPIQALEAAKAKMGGGTAFSANYEFDEGHWVYGVMVVKGHKITEVSIDPLTGKAVDAETLTPDDEAAEVKEDLSLIVKAGG